MDWVEEEADFSPLWVFLDLEVHNLHWTTPDIPESEDDGLLERASAFLQYRPERCLILKL